MVSVVLIATLECRVKWYRPPSQQMKSPTLPPLRNRRRVWQLASIGLLLVPLVAEIVVRVGFYRQLRTRCSPNIYEPDPALGYRYRPSSSGRLCIPDLCRTVTINENGYFGRPFPQQKRLGQYRVIVISNSDATGIWTADGESFVTLLRDRLQSVSDRVELLNLSVDGRDRDPEHLALAREAVRRYGPDLILLHVGVPFISRHQQREVYRDYVVEYLVDSPKSRAKALAAVDYLESQTVAKLVLDTSYLVRVLATAYLRHSSSNVAWLLQTYMTKRYSAGTPAVPESATKSLDALVQARQDFAVTGVRLLLLGDADDRALQTIATQAGLEVLTTHRPSGSENFLPTNAHLTHTGHDLVAEELYRGLLPRLRAWGVLEQPQANEAQVR